MVEIRIIPFSLPYLSHSDYWFLKQGNSNLGGLFFPTSGTDGPVKTTNKLNKPGFFSENFIMADYDTHSIYTGEG